MSCSLIETDGGPPQGTLGTALAGTLVSSLHRLKDTDNKDGAFFVWGDLSVKVEGTFRLQFTLFEMINEPAEVLYRASIMSDTFPVYSAKTFPGMAESTFITRAFSDQGVRLRLRKEPRALLRKRGPAHDDYEPRHYRTGNRQAGQGKEQQTQRLPEPQSVLRQTEQEELADMTQTQSYDQAQPQVGRHYSQQSSASWASSSMSYDDPSKRPRTGSSQGQSPTLDQQHNQPLTSPQYLQQQPFNAYPQTLQQTNFTFNYHRSPQTNTPPQDGYQYSSRIPTPQNMSPYGHLRSPTNTYPPAPGLRIAVPQAQQESYVPSPLQMMGPSPTTRVGNSFEDMGYQNRTQYSPLIARIPSMGPPLYSSGGGMNPNQIYGSSPGVSSSRDDTFQGFTGSGQNPPVTTTAGYPGPRGPTINSTGAPGSLGSSY